MKTIIAFLTIALLSSCSTVKTMNGTIATSLLGNVTLADGTSINHDSANKTVTKLGMTNIITGGVKSLAGTARGVLKSKDDNKVLRGSNNNALSGKLDDNQTTIKLREIDSTQTLEELKLNNPTPQP